MTKIFLLLALTFASQTKAEMAENNLKYKTPSGEKPPSTRCIVYNVLKDKDCKEITYCERFLDDPNDWFPTDADGNIIMNNSRCNANFVPGEYDTRK